jgi:NAD(P)-dependent dehydrogenase (short-subunit alcohol dehydrogenase family)
VLEPATTVAIECLYHDCRAVESGIECGVTSSYQSVQLIGGELVNDFVGKVAVITGAGSGIGRALAERCSREGMKVVLADIEMSSLAETESDLKESGADVLAVATDVANLEDVEALAQKTLDTFGAVHLLCNNAGVGVSTSVWECTINDWKWVLGVNLWGVIHGVHVFLPIMLRQKDDCHIVNTSSIAGLTAGPGGAPYKVSKHGVVTLSETLQQELERRRARIGVSVLCPAFVKTRIADADRNRPSTLRDDPAEVSTSAEAEALAQAGRQAIDQAIHPSTVAAQVFDAIIAGRFYIFTDIRARSFVEKRARDILAEANWQCLPEVDSGKAHESPSRAAH